MRNLKRALSMGLASTMIMGMVATGAGAVGYEDFADKDEIKNAEAVNTMVSLGVISGTDNGTFAPEGTLTRAQMCTLIARMLGGGKDPVLGNGGKSSFKDTQGHWAEQYIAYCANLGIIAGVGDGNFKPDDPLNGTAAAKMILCALGYKPEFEGIGGANWELATNTLASKVGLYADLDTLNPSLTINRDNVAQMIYNGVQAQEVEYRNLMGQHDGTVYATEIGTMLVNRFKVRKVEGVVEATDLIALDGNTTVTGKSRLTNIRYNGAAYQDSKGADIDVIYPIDIDDDLLGQRVVIYVKGLNDLSPNASSMEVIGSVIVSDDNTIVETTGRLKDTDAVRDALRKSGLAMPSDDKTSDHGVKITEDDTAHGGLTGVEAMPGVAQRFIDHNADGTVDVVIAKNPALAKVNTYNDKDSKLNLSGIGSVNFSDILNADDVDQGDYVLVYNYDGTYILEQADSISGTVTAYVDNSSNVALSKITMDGTNYGAGAGKNLASELITPVGADFSDLVDGTYTLYLDPHGNILGYVEDEGAVGSYAVITGVNPTGTTAGFYAVEVKLILSDGTTGKYDVNLLASAKKWNATTANATSNAAKEEAMFNALALGGSPYPGVGELVAYSLDNGTVTLSKPAFSNSRTYGAATTGANLGLQNTKASYDFNGTKVMADNRTVFFIKDGNGNYSAIAGLSKLRSSALSTTGTSKVIYYTPTGSSANIARAVYVVTTETYTSNSSYAFITGNYTKSTVNNETIYTYPVVLEDGTVTTLASRTDEGLQDDRIHEYQNDGSYVTFNGAGQDRMVNGKLVTSVGSNAVSVADVDNDAIGKDSFAINNAKVWDVQDTENVFETKLQKGQKVALVLTDDGDVKTAFVYGSVDDDFVTAVPVSYAGTALTDGATTTVAGNAAPRALTFSIPKGVKATIYVDNTKVGEHDNTSGTAALAVSENIAVDSSEIVEIKVTLSEDGKASRTLKFTVKGSTSGGADPDAAVVNPAAPDAADQISAGLTDGDVLVTGSLSGVKVDVPASTTIEIQGSYAPTADASNAGKIVVNGNYAAPDDASAEVAGEVVADSMTIANNTDVTGNTTINGTLTPATGATDPMLTVADNAQLTVTGTVTTDVTTEDGSTVEVGSIDGNLTMNGGNVVVNGPITGDITLSDITESDPTATATLTIGSEEDPVDMTLTGLEVPDGFTVTLNGETVTVSGGVVVESPDTLIVNGDLTTSSLALGVSDNSSTGRLVISGKLTVEGEFSATADSVIEFGASASVDAAIANKFVDAEGATVTAVAGKTFTANAEGKMVVGGDVTPPTPSEDATANIALKWQADGTAGGSQAASDPGAVAVGPINNAVTSVVITLSNTAAQTVAVSGTDESKVTLGAAGANQTVTVNTTDVATTGGSVVFTLTVSETEKTDITYNVTVTVAAPEGPGGEEGTPASVGGSLTGSVVVKEGVASSAAEIVVAVTFTGEPQWAANDTVVITSDGSDALNVTATAAGDTSITWTVTGAPTGFTGQFNGSSLTLTAEENGAKSLTLGDASVTVSCSATSGATATGSLTFTDGEDEVTAKNVALSANNDDNIVAAAEAASVTTDGSIVIKVSGNNLALYVGSTKISEDVVFAADSALNFVDASNNALLTAQFDSGTVVGDITADIATGLTFTAAVEAAGV